MTWQSNKRLVVAVLASGVLGCGGGFRPYPPKAPIWRDADNRLHGTPPEEYFSPFAWDAADQIIFRPVTRFFAVTPAGEAVNVNAWDEVPDSSWFQNRIGRYGMTPKQVARGVCTTAPLEPRGPWVVKDAKPNGANPGFIIKDQAGRRYLLKFDGVAQGPRATAADVIVSRMYHAAGYFTPCNRIVFFRRSILSIDPEATSENEQGDEVPMTETDLDQVFSKALRAPDGRYRASSSLFLDGQPLGPFKYQGTRADDPNDVIPHEDRRELRAARLLAGWVNHFDSREQNTLTMWIEVAGRGGYVRHNIIDFGDCFGSIWEPPMLGRRIGHSSYLDPGHIVQDFVTFGLINRPWDRARFGPSGPVFGYFGVERFEPTSWKPGYPNPAMNRMSERDGAWMARILSRFGNAHIRAVIKTGKLGDPFLAGELERILIGRRDKILRRYLSRLSSLAWPEVRPSAQGQAELCMTDLAVQSGLFGWPARTIASRAWLTTELTPARTGAMRVASGGRVCVALPAVPGASRATPRYAVVDLLAYTGSQPRYPARVHLYHLGRNDYVVVGIERPGSAAPPDD